MYQYQFDTREKGMRRNNFSLIESEWEIIEWKISFGFPFFHNQYGVTVQNQRGTGSNPNWDGEGCFAIQEVRDKVG